MTFTVENTEPTWKRVLDEQGICMAYLEETSDGRWQLSDNITGELLVNKIFANTATAMEWFEKENNNA